MMRLLIITAGGMLLSSKGVGEWIGRSGVTRRNLRREERGEGGPPENSIVVHDNNVWIPKQYNPIPLPIGSPGIHPGN